MMQVDMHDPNAQTTITRLEVAQKICKDSGTLSNRFVVFPLTNALDFHFETCFIYVAIFHCLANIKAKIMYLSILVYKLKSCS